MTSDRVSWGIAAFQPHHLLSFPSEETVILPNWEMEGMFLGCFLPTGLGDLPESVMKMKVL